MPQGSSAVRPTNGLYLYLFEVSMARFDIHPLQLLAFIGEYLALVNIRKGLGPRLI